MKKVWCDHIFGTRESADDVDRLMSACVPDFSEPVRVPELPPITGAGMLVLLPRVEAHARLGQMLVAFEKQAPWPESVCHWKMVMLPTQTKGILPTLEEVKPIAIGFAIYRLWGRIRLRHLAATLAQDCIQAGGIGGEDVSSLLLPTGVGCDSASYPRLMALDFADEAFDHARAGVQPVKRAVEQSAEVDGLCRNLRKISW